MKKYDKIVLSNSKHRKCLVVTEYHSGVKDTTGLGGTWQGSGSLYDVFKVGVYYVALNPFNQKPVQVWQSMEEMVGDLKDLCEEIITA